MTVLLIEKLRSTAVNLCKTVATPVSDATQHLTIQTGWWIDGLSDYQFYIFRANLSKPHTDE